MEKRLLRLDIWRLVIAAAVMRAGYLLIGIADQGLRSVVTASSDTTKYLWVAEYLQTGAPELARWLFKYGPGYGLILACANTLAGPHLAWQVLPSLLAGIASPIIVYLLARNLLGDRWMAVVAGVICCCTPISLSMSTSILTDQPFFALSVTSLFFLSTGYKTGAWKWFILSGIVASFSALVRPSAQLWPLILITLGLLAPRTGLLRSRRNVLSRIAASAAIMLLVMMGWSTYNLYSHGVFTFGDNGLVTSRRYLAARAVAFNTPEESIFDVRDRWDKMDAIHWGDQAPTPAQEYRRAGSEVWRLARQHPDWLVTMFWYNVRTNAVRPDHFLKYQIPAFTPIWNWYFVQATEWLAITVLLLTAAGIIITFGKKKTFAGLLLLTTFVYFIIITGFSFWQGARLAFPSQMASSILIAVALVDSGRLAVATFRSIWKQWLAISAWGIRHLGGR